MWGYFFLIDVIKPPCWAKKSPLENLYVGKKNLSILTKVRITNYLMVKLWTNFFWVNLYKRDLSFKGWSLFHGSKKSQSKEWISVYNHWVSYQNAKLLEMKCEVSLNKFKNILVCVLIDTRKGHAIYLG